jgi:hypothetical protein
MGRGRRTEVGEEEERGQVERRRRSEAGRGRSQGLEEEGGQ